MRVLDFFRGYFNGFYDFLNYKNNDNKTNALALLKIFSYFTLGIPLVVVAILLAERVTQKKHLSFHDKKVIDQAKKVFGSDKPIKLLKCELSDVLSAYLPHFRQRANAENLQEYSKSEDYQRHAKTARIYYNSSQLAEEDALQIIFQREPTNISMGANQYNKEALAKLFNYECGVYNDVSARKKNNFLFSDLPNSAAVYSETYLWNPPGGKTKKEIACLSLPAPALDSVDQPHYKYYMKTGQLDAKKYEQEMAFLFRCIEGAVRDNKDNAFGKKGINRIVLSRFGQGVFLNALSLSDRKVAYDAYKKQMHLFIDRIKDTHLECVMSEHSDPGADRWLDKMIIGDIIETTREGDLVINAWDPHSAPGNGNDTDRSFDGAMGKGSGIILTQTSWLNETLRSKHALAPIL